MAKQSKRQMKPAPGVSLGRDLRKPELCATTLPKGGFLDGTVAAKNYEHPCVRWAAKPVQDLRPREALN